MKIAVLVYRPEGSGWRATLVLLDPFKGQLLRSLEVLPGSSLGLFPTHDCMLVNYHQDRVESPCVDWLNVYRFSDWSLRASLPMDVRAHFNVLQNWSPFLASPTGSQIYLYKSRTLGDHKSDDWVCSLDSQTLKFSPWNFRFPECVAGWAAAGDAAHAQMLFVSDGLEAGQLPTANCEQKLAFWLGPDKGMGPVIPLGPRPNCHSDLGHARAVLLAPHRPLSVVVCNNGTTHLIDPRHFSYLERQQVALPGGHGMPIFAAQVDPAGRFLYVGASTHGARCQGLSERLVVHDLISGGKAGEWRLQEPVGHMALSSDGQYLCGVSPEHNCLSVFDARAGVRQVKVPLDGAPYHLVPVG